MGQSEGEDKEKEMNSEKKIINRYLWIYIILGVNALLVITFWANSHFGPEIDFVPIVVFIFKKSFLF